MKRLVMLALLPLVLSACSLSLRTHAQVVSATGSLLDTAGAEIEKEAREDYDRIMAAGEAQKCDAEQTNCVTLNVEQQVALLQQSFAPIERFYETARQAHGRYLRAILDALERGQRTLEQRPATELLDAWLAVAEAADGVGVAVPAPPAALVRIASGDP